MIGACYGYALLEIVLPGQDSWGADGAKRCDVTTMELAA